MIISNAHKQRIRVHNELKKNMIVRNIDKLVNECFAKVKKKSFFAFPSC